MEHTDAFNPSLSEILRIIVARLEPVDDHPDACWRMRGCAEYPRVKINGASITAHRFICGLITGPIPDTWVVDHDCHNRDPRCRDDRDCPHRRCIRPDHLVARTQSENITRGRQRDRYGRGGVVVPMPNLSLITPATVDLLRDVCAVVSEYRDGEFVLTETIARSLGMTAWQLGRSLFVFGVRTRNARLHEDPTGRKRKGYDVATLRDALDAARNGYGISAG